MNSEDFEERVHKDCLRIMRFLASKRYDSAGRYVAALALLAEEQGASRLCRNAISSADPYDLRLLEAFDREDDDRD